ncbi:MAG: hypothetical protein COV10_00865 [Candidatus Vogelbacteria bacterium CG10_big_fil_rev_8_21_14_0_10_51_16]|uniref:Uncharacterized protein n=1 Tax=Candidatus Vogelbacteria bacterium CG10_big_fil_rev_8_21_14_0_10_51_16 TaxID=1975045 RepID=A0A2H0RF76_9BACT|nr:MAG: hypothetical protein COV10_00865 [Candidatus Vogelbacteria bacterium CG10_big_fil_rev_8_21_14_0_10_51_16]
MGQDTPGHFEIEGEGAVGQRGVRADFFDPIFLSGKILGQSRNRGLTALSNKVPAKFEPKRAVPLNLF